MALPDRLSLFFYVVFYQNSPFNIFEPVVFSSAKNFLQMSKYKSLAKLNEWASTLSFNSNTLCLEQSLPFSVMASRNLLIIFIICPNNSGFWRWWFFFSFKTMQMLLWLILDDQISKEPIILFQVQIDDSFFLKLQ